MSSNDLVKQTNRYAFEHAPKKYWVKFRNCTKLEKKRILKYCWEYKTLRLRIIITFPMSGGYRILVGVFKGALTDQPKHIVDVTDIEYMLKNF